MAEWRTENETASGKRWLIFNTIPTFHSRAQSCYVPCPALGTGCYQKAVDPSTLMILHAQLFVGTMRHRESTDSYGTIMISNQGEQPACY